MDYIEDQIREKIADQIRYLELPYEWKPNDVLNYIVRKIEKKQEQYCQISVKQKIVRVWQVGLLPQTQDIYRFVTNATRKSIKYDR